MLMNVLEHHNPVGCAAHSSRGRGVVGNTGEAVDGGWLKQVLAGVRAERLARRIESVRAKDGDTRNVAKAVVKDEDGSVLLLRDAHYGSWDLPGGHLTEGESYEDGLRREVREETGLEIISETRRENHANGIIYDATVSGRKPHVTLSDEHNDYKWVQEGKAKEMSAFWLGGYEGHEAVRNGAEAAISRAVGRIVLLAEANAIARKKDSEFLDYATLILAAALATAYGKAAKDLANLATGEDRGESLTHNEEMEYAKGRQNVLDGFLDNVRERVSSEKGRGSSLGETDQELAERIRKAGEEVIAGSGKVVAETEAQAIYGHAQFRALKRAGYKTAFWVTVGDERVRDSHTACEAAGAVKIGDKFPNGLLFPGDPNGGPEEICNCRCWLEGASRR